MNKVYLSGPITGTPDYLSRFEKAEEVCKRTPNVSVVNPAKVNACLPENTSYEEYMDMAFLMLKMCDTIYMMHGWEKSCGANREYGYALGAGMNIIFEDKQEEGRWNIKLGIA